MKFLIIRVSSLFKVFVLTLIFSVFLQASLASAIDIESQADLELIGVMEGEEAPSPLDGDYVVTASFTVETVTGSTYIVGTFTGTFNGGGNTISGLTKPLFDVIGGDVSDLNLASGIGESGVIGNGALTNVLEIGGTIDNVSFTGDVTGIGNDVGGLVGLTDGTIDNSYAAGEVDGGAFAVGGLVGYSAGAITNSYATGVVDGENTVGGLVGESTGTIDNSYATGVVMGIGNDVGGLVGYSGGAITNSYVTGDVTGTDNVGGLVGSSNGPISNSYAAGDVGGADDVGGLVGYSNGAISNSYAAGAVTGTGINNDEELALFSDVGGLVGENYGAITNSNATGNVTGALVYTGLLVGFSGGTINDDSSGYGAANIDGTLIEDDPYLGEGEAPNILNIVNTSLGDDFVPAFAVNASINDGLPYLISLIDSYDVADTEETPFFSLRSYYAQAAKSLNKALISFGFKSNFSAHPSLGFQALEQNQSNSPAVIQLFEVSEYQNSNILLSKEDGLQLSISSSYKEPVEIWTQGLDGEYLYLGLVEFDKDGKAILPTLKFDTAKTYEILMIKAADKLSQKPNLEAKVGQIAINVF